MTLAGQHLRQISLQPQNGGDDGRALIGKARGRDENRDGKGLARRVAKGDADGGNAVGVAVVLRHSV